MARSVRARTRSRGQSLVAFAILFPCFLFVILAIAQYALIYYTVSAINEGARDGARFASINPAGDVSTFVKGRTVLDPSQLTVSVTFPDGNSAANSRVSVNVRYNMQHMFFPGLSARNFASTSTMRIEAQS